MVKSISKVFCKFQGKILLRVFLVSLFLLPLLGSGVIKPVVTDVVSDVVKSVAGVDDQLGAEMVTNGDFADWTADNPDSWTIVNENASNYITEHVNGAGLVSNNTANLTVSQNPFAIGTLFEVSFSKSNHVSGSIRWQNPETKVFENIAGTNANGTFTVRVTAAQITLNIFRDNSGNTDYVMNEISVKEVL